MLQMCPHCGQAAPLVYRGVLAYCSACGQLRGPLTGRSVTHAGQVSKAGGVVAKVVAWIALSIGASFGLFFGALLGWWVVASIIAVLSLTVFGLLMWGGRSLSRTGQKSETDTKASAVFALAASRRGELRARDLVSALTITREEAEALLESMSKQHPDDVSLEVDDDGGLYYVFSRYRQRVDASAQSESSSSVVDPLLEQFAELEAAEAASLRKHNR